MMFQEKAPAVILALLTSLAIAPQPLATSYSINSSATHSLSTAASSDSATENAAVDNIPVQTMLATAGGTTPPDSSDRNGAGWLWLLLPAILLLLLMWWLKSRRRSDTDATSIPPSTATSSESLPAAPASEDLSVESNSELATRAESVISSDRQAIANNRPGSPSPSPDLADIPVSTDTPALDTPALDTSALDTSTLDTSALAHASIPEAPEVVQPDPTPLSIANSGAALSEPPEPLPSDPPDLPLDASVEEPIPPLAATVPPVSDNSDVPEELEVASLEAAALPDALAPVETKTAAAAISEPAESMVLVEGAALTKRTGATSQLPLGDDQSTVEAAKFDVGQTDLSSESLAAVDEDLPDLPQGYGESRIVLLPRDPQWAYVYWDISNEHKEELRQQGGQRLALRFYDVTDIDINYQRPHSLQQFDCEEMARDWYIPVPVSDRDYMIEIGYLTGGGGWLMLSRSTPVRIPPVYPSDWFEDLFLTVNWDEDLRTRTFVALIPPSQRTVASTDNPIYDEIFDLAQSFEAQRVAGSLFGSMQTVPEQAISSYVFPSGVGMWALPTLSGITMSGVGMSGVGFAASIPPIRPRKFWLVADAELIVYGATEPDATVTIGDRPIKLNPDGTFRFQMSFRDGLIDYPIVATAADGEQQRSIHMEFVRKTPDRNTNTKDEAVDEWPF